MSFRSELDVCPSPIPQSYPALLWYVIDRWQMSNITFVFLITGEKTKKAAYWTHEEEEAFFSSLRQFGKVRLTLDLPILSASFAACISNSTGFPLLIHMAAFCQVPFCFYSHQAIRCNSLLAHFAFFCRTLRRFKPK